MYNTINYHRGSEAASLLSGMPYSQPGPNKANKLISLVPDVEPWKSPSMDYSRNVFLTSNYDDYDPAKIVKKLERNKLVHGSYDVHLVSSATRGAFQEIIDKKVDKNDKMYVNVVQKFKEKAPSVIEKMKMEKAEAELKQKALLEERR